MSLVKFIEQHPKSFIGILSFALIAPYVIGIHTAPHHDAMVFTVWLKTFAQEFYSGNFLPRWSSIFQDGYGRPDFYFYPPVLFYLGLLFYWPPVIAAFPFFQTWAAASLIFILSGLSCFVLLKRFASTRNAIMGAIIYQAFANHFSIGIVYRSGISEQLNYVWLPLLVLLTIDIMEKFGVRSSQYVEKKLATSHWPLVTKLGIICALSVLSNIPTSLIVVPVPMLLVLLKIASEKNIKANADSFLAILLAYTIGAALSAWHWLPITEMRHWIRENCVTSFYKVAENFVPFVTNETAPILLNYYSLAAGLCSLLLIWKISALREKKESVFKNPFLWVALIVIGYFMMTAASKPLWDYIPMLNLVQFPWRFGILICLAFSVIIALCPEGDERNKAAVVFITIGVVTGIGLSLLPLKVIHDGGEDAEGIIKLRKNAAIQIESSYSLAPEYYPKEAKLSESCNNQEVYDYYRENFPHQEKSLALLSKGRANVQVINWQSGWIELDVNAAKPSEILLHQFYFPTWKSLNEEVQINQDNKFGLLAVSVPEGRHHITIQAEPTRLEVIGRWISIISLFCCLGALLVFKNDKAKA